MRRTWSIGVAAILVATVPASARAAVVAWDDFESYVVGGGLNGGSGGSGWTAAWEAHSEVTAQADVIPGLGRSLQIDTNRSDNNIAQRSFPAQTGTVYVGLDLRTTGGWDVPDFFQIYLNNTAPALGVDSSPSSVSGGASNAAGSPYFARTDVTSVNSTTAFHADDRTDFVILKFSKSASVYDRSEIYVNPKAGAAANATRTGATLLNSLSTLHLRTNSIEDDQRINLDSVRIGTTWQDVLPARETIAAEPFQTGPGAYDVSSPLPGQGPVVAGFTGDWREVVGGTAKFHPTPTGLDVPAAIESGGAAQITSAASYSGNNVVQRDLVDFGRSSTYYFSGMLSLDDDGAQHASGAAQALITFGDSNGAGTHLLNFGVRDGNVIYRLLDGSGFTAYTIRSGYAADEVLHLIVKVEVDPFGSGNYNDRVTFILNPSDIHSEALALATAEATAVDTTHAVFSNGGDYPVDYLELSVNNLPGVTLAFDEIRFGTSYASVVNPVPEPASLLLMGLGLAALVAMRRGKLRV